VSVAFECKKRLELAGKRMDQTAVSKEGYDELMRDYAHTLPRMLPMPDTSLHYGFGVLCDGVRWQIVRMLVHSNGSLHFSLSDAYEFWADDSKAKTTKFKKTAARTFFELCVLAALARHDWTYAFAWELPSAVNSDTFRLTEIVSAHHNGCVVVRYTSGAQRMLAKFAVPKNSTASDRLKHEIDARAELDRLGLGAHVCVAEVTTVLGHRALVFDDSEGAQSVSEWLTQDLSSELVESLAKRVFVDLSAALKALHDAKMTFVDIHPGNIVLACDKGTWQTARLIDCESLCACGTSLNDKRILLRKEFSPAEYVDTNNNDVKTTFKGDDTSLLLVFAWIVDEDKFRSAGMSSAKSGDSAEGVKQWGNKKSSLLTKINKKCAHILKSNESM
jgi:hypothetical protein